MRLGVQLQGRFPPALPNLLARATAWLLTGMLLAAVSLAHAADAGIDDAPLVIGGRSIHVFRSALGDVSPAERADAARRHIDRALVAAGPGWTSISPVENGILVKLDGKPMFTITAGDVAGRDGETTESLANSASRVLHTVWAEAQDRRDPSVDAAAILKVVAAFAVLAGLLFALGSISRLLRGSIARSLSRHVERLDAAGISSDLSGLVLRLIARASSILLLMFGLLATFGCIAYSLAQFTVTRPVSEGLVGSLNGMLSGGWRAVIEAIPNLFVAVIIFLCARITTQVSRSLFDAIAEGRLHFGSLDAHTARATRQLVNIAIWLFALAMSYPYLPGAHTEAFKGLSVLLGVMVSIGASGLVGQVASGLILVFTRALLVGEYVRIQESEGTVTELGLCVTRLRTGTGEEVALPNSLVLSNVTRNFSRNAPPGGFVLDTEVTIGYDTPWRQVHAMLLEAAQQVPGRRDEPAPFVVQTALSDFYVAYRLVLQAGPDRDRARPRLLSDLNAAIQDVFNRHGVQIMSPHYMMDPESAKLVPEAQWRKPPAASA
jgi:small-conductance mechanosensitive channel